MMSDTRKKIADLVAEFGANSLSSSGLYDAVIAGEEDFPLADLGIDSLGAMELSMVLESEFGLDIRPDNLASYGTLGALAQAADQALAGPILP